MLRSIEVFDFFFFWISIRSEANTYVLERCSDGIILGQRNLNYIKEQYKFNLKKERRASFSSEECY